MVGVDVKGILVCDKSGLILTSRTKLIISSCIYFCFLTGKDVTVSPGPIACLADLASSLSERRTTICLEHNEK